MARWGRTFFHKFRDKIKEQKGLLDTLCDLTDEESVRKFLEAKDALNNLLSQGRYIGNKEQNYFGRLKVIKKRGSFTRVLLLVGNKIILNTWLMTVM